VYITLSSVVIGAVAIMIMLLVKSVGSGQRAPSLGFREIHLQGFYARGVPRNSEFFYGA
jgi:hypothetical protein